MKKFTKYYFENMWNISFEDFRAEGEFTYDDKSASLKGENFIIEAKVTDSHGVSCRVDSITNTSEKPLHISTFRPRFVLQRSEYEFYSQYNAWQNESQGAWSESATGISLKNESVRTSMGVAPFIGLWNKQTNRGFAFHLIPDGSWMMSAEYNSLGGKNGWLTVEMGVWADNLCLVVNPGETLTLPEVWYYEFKDKLSMDSYKLHRYALDRYPRKPAPVVYNSWLYKFDRFDFESLIKQVPVAAKLGCEYFTIDAGWFGHGPSWVKQIGDWNENMISGFMGRTIDIANEVRKCGMKFGLWLEFTRAVEGSVAAKEHPEYFIKNGRDYFIDFTNEEAYSYIMNITESLIEKYGIEYFKFDNNADMRYDYRRSGFTKYFEGFKRFLKELREKYPHIYIEGCASGGQNLNLSGMRYFDSIWMSDNQGVYFGTRLIKDSVRRLPSQLLERWSVISSFNSMETYFHPDAGHIISTGDATCEYVTGVDLSYLKGFLSGGPIGFSCDLTSLSEDVFESLRQHIEEFKKDREFIRTAECRVLADTKSVIALQYSDKDLKKNVIQVFTSDLAQEGLYVYPDLNQGKTYIVGEEEISADEISENGLYIPLSGSYRMNSMSLIEK